MHRNLKGDLSLVLGSGDRKRIPLGKKENLRKFEGNGKKSYYTRLQRRGGKERFQVVLGF